MTYRKRYEAWLADAELDEELRLELEAIAEDDEAIKERFYQNLSFGTGGMRGIMGAGINRMNRYTVQKATAGFACYLLDKHQRTAQESGVVIAYDSRYNSRKFAEEAALVIAAYGIKVYIFDRLTPTPVLSFAVPYLNAIGGIVITASHNTKEYNGYKVYDQYGCQLVPDDAETLLNFVARFEDNDSIPIIMSREIVENDGLLKWLDDKVLRAFENAVAEQALPVELADKAALSVVYTPLHGTGRVPVMMALERDGFTDVELVSAQAEPDGGFTTVRSPNPEEKDALALAIACAKVKGADIVLGTDPDCDRIGVAVRTDEGWRLMTGNEIGALLVDFVLQMRIGRLKERSVIIKTIVTSDLGARIAESYGVAVQETLTGFKFIGQKMNQFKLTGSHHFVMGYEESYGYLIGRHARDKDAVSAAMIICEMAAWYKANGLTLLDGLQRLYERFGYYLDEVQSFTLEGISGSQRIKELMTQLRSQEIQQLGAMEISRCKDYSEGIDGLPVANVLKYTFADGGWMAVRPSGTEPKIKFYYSLQAADEAQAHAKLAALKEAVAQLMSQ